MIFSAHHRLPCRGHHPELVDGQAVVAQSERGISDRKAAHDWIGRGVVDLAVFDRRIGKRAGSQARGIPPRRRGIVRDCDKCSAHPLRADADDVERLRVRGPRQGQERPEKAEEADGNVTT